jgi:hypothetical protein
VFRPKLRNERLYFQVKAHHRPAKDNCVLRFKVLVIPLKRINQFLNEGGWIQTEPGKAVHDHHGTPHIVALKVLCYHIDQTLYPLILAIGVTRIPEMPIILAQGLSAVLSPLP